MALIDRQSVVTSVAAISARCNGLPCGAMLVEPVMKSVCERDEDLRLDNVTLMLCSNTQ